MNVEQLKRMQFADGSFGPFHSMSSNGNMTTEKALRRFHALKVPRDNVVLAKTLDYVGKCLKREVTIPDRAEKVIHWHAFEELMFSSWLTLFGVQHDTVGKIKNTWVEMIERSMFHQRFDSASFEQRFQQIYGRKKQHERILNPICFYAVVLVKNSLSSSATEAYFDYVMDRGIYYVYDKPLVDVPKRFDSRETFRFLEAIKLVSSFTKEKAQLRHVKEWILKHQRSDGYWYLSNIRSDGIMFPQSEHWRFKANKLNDLRSYLMDVLSVCHG